MERRFETMDVMPETANAVWSTIDSMIHAGSVRTPYRTLAGRTIDLVRYSEEASEKSDGTLILLGGFIQAQQDDVPERSGYIFYKKGKIDSKIITYKEISDRYMTLRAMSEAEAREFQASLVNLTPV